MKIDYNFYFSECFASFPDCDECVDNNGDNTITAGECTQCKASSYMMDDKSACLSN